MPWLARIFHQRIGICGQGAEVHVFHGKSDRLVSLTHGKDAVDLLRANGVKVKFTEFEGGVLGIFTTVKPAITQSMEAKIYSLW